LNREQNIRKMELKLQPVKKQKQITMTPPTLKNMKPTNRR
jgi:hypothetical protein